LKRTIRECTRIDAKTRIAAGHAAALVGAEADRIYPHAWVDGLLGGFQRWHAGGGHAVGKQHNDMRHISSLGQRRGLVWSGGRLAMYAARHARIDLGDRIDRFKDAAADRRGARGGQAFHRACEPFLVGRRRLHQLCVAGERHHGDLGRGSLALDKRQRGGLGGPEPVGRDIVLQHAARNVDGQDNRRPAARHRHQADRAPQGDDQAAEREHQQGKGQMAPQHPHIGRDDQRYGRQQKQELGPHSRFIECSSW